MGDDDDGLSLFMSELFQQLHDQFRILFVQIAGGLVGGDDLGVGRQCPCDGDALLLTA